MNINSEIYWIVEYRDIDFWIAVDKLRHRRMGARIDRLKRIKDRQGRVNAILLGLI